MRDRMQSGPSLHAGTVQKLEKSEVLLLTHCGSALWRADSLMMACLMANGAARSFSKTAARLASDFVGQSLSAIHVAEHLLNRDPRGGDRARRFSIVGEGIVLARIIDGEAQADQLSRAVHNR